jgi:Raf kinase inhibitor-like YbhB/YbcL family protein
VQSRNGGIIVGRYHPLSLYRLGSKSLIALACALLLLIFISSQSADVFAQTKQSGDEQADKVFQLTSTAFEADGAIPVKYSCAGANISPGLTWTDPPTGTQSYVLIVDDPDASAATPAVHWLVYAIPAMQRGLEENTLRKATLPNNVKQGKNSAGKVGYGGPCPDPGKVHHYFFKLYALDYTPDLKAKMKITDVEAALKDHVLAKSELIGRFQHE